ncbi:hypothetical protein I307_00528 [Cryptococcus deuterogattii 99/473]|uniref:Unplaced genomic scaffold supercont1.4, whole genome shotgun sequence n=1 Tax=Cryptococcus deuterogattii Ram5 TaxID=1296110 RepID=A0A0D0V575_9TREE|nr:hypothetical protein I309_02899 [Cryptococcus deuterogattii LA55]KIR41804.1 hypothetical protein I313_01964 [Cryptococcus deuterogattii Ram5]KIR73371.1 hypothetical protein I310_03037 [Cryptococcus deuterogattii CA1014]KIR91706.1 hypothetical protein I304_04530 [Cryptococcus deuterogattii CBS 10090]KIR99127.1 hypothetical protein L804_03749 [Cryptococcus deuterogattii 2001/935-1]KIY60082.1 hypothetical protein I307_00528 [Cryptococcus deuterogattii 99/473]
MVNLLKRRNHGDESTNNHCHKHRISLHSQKAKHQFASSGFGTCANESPSKPFYYAQLPPLECIFLPFRYKGRRSPVAQRTCFIPTTGGTTMVKLQTLDSGTIYMPNRGPTGKRPPQQHSTGKVWHLEHAVTLPDTGIFAHTPLSS